MKGAAIESELTNCIDALWSDQGWIPLVSPRRLERTETESDFDFTIGENTEITIGDISSQNFGVALEASFDGRDNVFTPNSGQLLKLAVWRHDEAIGSDFDYWKGTFSRPYRFTRYIRVLCWDCAWRQRLWMAGCRFMPILG